VYNGYIVRSSSTSSSISSSSSRSITGNNNTSIYLKIEEIGEDRVYSVWYIYIYGLYVCIINYIVSSIIVHLGFFLQNS